MIKIALISHTAAFAGAERMLFNLACLLQNSTDFEPVVLLPESEMGEKSPFFNCCKEQKISVVWMGGYSGYATWYLFGEKGETDASGRQAMLAAKQDLEWQLVKLKVDMVLCNTATSLVPVLAAAVLELPVVTWVHGILDNTYLPIEQDAEQRLLFDRTLIALSDQVLCCSQWTANFYQQYALSPVRAVANWTPDLLPARQSEQTEEPQPSGETFEKEKVHFICLNTFEEHKGIFLLLRAVRLLVSRKCPIPFELELYGSGAPKFEEKMRQYIVRHKLQKYVILRPRTTEIAAVYSRAFCLLQPSNLEPFGMTIIEAMSAAKPVIATRSGGPSEIIVDGQTGCLIERDNEKEMAAQMLNLMEHPETAAAMGAAGRKRYLEQYSEAAARDTVLPPLRTAYEAHCGFTHAQRLILDLTMQHLKSSAGNTAAVGNGAHGPTVVSYNPDALCFSGVLRKNRSYNISGVAGTISGVGLLLANVGGSLEHGKVTLRLSQGGELLTQSTLSGGDLKMDNWTWFGFEPITLAAAPLTVEICSEGLDGLGVFELRERRGFFYKVFNKLGCPLKGLDVLQASLLR